MTNIELLATIRAEIERRIALYSLLSENTVNPNRIDEDRQLLSFLSDIEKSLPSKVADREGLEEEIKRYHDDMDGDCRYVQTARHFYDLGCRRTAEKYDELEYNRQRAEESPLPEDTVLFNNGVEEGKRLMMEEAVEGEVMLNPYPTICLDDCKDYDFKDGDKVRVIIVKKED